MFKKSSLVLIGLFVGLLSLIGQLYARSRLPVIKTNIDSVKSFRADNGQSNPVTQLAFTPGTITDSRRATVAFSGMSFKYFVDSYSGKNYNIDVVVGAASLEAAVRETASDGLHVKYQGNVPLQIKYERLDENGNVIDVQTPQVKNLLPYNFYYEWKGDGSGEKFINFEIKITESVIKFPDGTEKPVYMNRGFSVELNGATK